MKTLKPTASLMPVYRFILDTADGSSRSRRRIARQFSRWTRQDPTWCHRPHRVPYSFSNPFDSALQIAIREGNVKAVRWLLSHVDPWAIGTESGCALWQAAYSQQAASEQIFGLLLPAMIASLRPLSTPQKRAYECEHKEGQRYRLNQAFSIVARTGRLSLMKTLLPWVDPFWTNRYGVSALMLANVCGQLATV